MSIDEKAALEAMSKDDVCSEAGIVEVASAKQSYLLKLDLRLIPILGCTYTVLFLDRSNSECYCKQQDPILTICSRQC
jgi:hypothetical protein